VEACDLDLVCEVDPFRVEQVVRNVLENGVSACDDSGILTAAFTAVEIDEAAAVCITVANDGSPLTPEERERIFEAFFTKKTRGSGLGMAISRRIVEAHGGRIAVGQPQNGVEIVITLPKSPA
jgi:signal transduction histidine kinase